MKSKIDTVIQRTQRYWYVDGLNEIATGLIILLIGIYFLVVNAFSTGALSAVMVGIGVPVLMLALAWAGGKIVKMLKERITYPRTGYIAFNPQKGGRRSKLKTAFIAAGVAIAFAFLQVMLHPELSRVAMPILTAALIALAVALLGFRFGLVRFYYLAVYTALMGLLTAWLPLYDLGQNIFLFIMFGLGWVVSGAITLVRYLASTKPAGEEEV